MKTFSLLIACAVFSAGVACAAEADPTLDAAMAKAVLMYTERTQAATKELAQTRERIAKEKAPLAENIRTLEEQIIVLQADLARLEVEKAGAQEKAQRQKTESETLNRNLSYFANLGLDSIKGFEANLLAGETDSLGERVQTLRQKLETGGHPADAFAALDVADFFLKHVEQQIGGYTAPGRSLVQGGNQFVEGTFAFVGPEVFFRPTAGGAAGTVRLRSESDHAVTFPLADWPAAKADALFRGEKGSLMADVTGGKALRLRETKGTILDGIRKGGTVAYVILALGAVSVAITLMKIVDLRHLAVDEPATVQVVTRSLAQGARKEAQAAIEAFRTTTRELYLLGLKYADAPKTILEEHLEGFVLRQRLHHERRLPLLAVIATAGPLLGLLGTVTGMIKTFTLITVFGSGSAGKLSGGISEALVATELGLAVAIPTLVIHGFLSHRVHKGLAMLERYSLELVTAVEESRAEPSAEKTFRP